MRINSFLSYIFLVEFLRTQGRFFGDLRVEFLICSFLYKISVFVKAATQIQEEEHKGFLKILTK